MDVKKIENDVTRAKEWAEIFKKTMADKPMEYRQDIILSVFPAFDFDKDYENEAMMIRFNAVIETCRFDLMDFGLKNFYFKELKKAYEDLWGNAHKKYGDIIKYVDWEDENNKFRLGCEKYLGVKWKDLPPIPTIQKGFFQTTETK